MLEIFRPKRASPGPARRSAYGSLRWITRGATEKTFPYREAQARERQAPSAYRREEMQSPRLKVFEGGMTA